MEYSTENLDDALEESMKRLIQAMRYLLTNMEEEQRALTLGLADSVRFALQARDLIIEQIAASRRTMISVLSRYAPCSDEKTLEEINLVIGDDKITHLVLRDQILALDSCIEMQSHANRSFFVRQTAVFAAPKKQALAVIERSQ